MINESQFEKILSINNNKLKRNSKTFFGSPLKKFIDSLYHTFNIPKESFSISLFYIHNFYIKNMYNLHLMDKLFNNINIFVFTSIIISLKNLFDEYFDIKYMCNMTGIDYNKFLDTEIIILQGLEWNTFFENSDYFHFKRLLENYIH